jgi:hypothetical protein
VEVDTLFIVVALGFGADIPVIVALIVELPPPDN